MTDVLDDGTGRPLELLAGASLLAQSIRQLIILEGHSVRAPSASFVFAPVAFVHLVLDLVVVAGDLCLDSREHLQLRSSPGPYLSENRKLFVFAVVATTADLAEEHQCAPLLLNCPQEVAGTTRHETHGLLWDIQHRQIAIVVVVRDGDRACSLSHHALGVLLGAASLQLRASDLEDEVALEKLDLGLGNPGDFLLGLAALAKDECSVVVRDFHCVHAIVVGLFVFPVATAWAPAPAPAFLAAAAAALAALAAAAAASRAAHGLGGALRNLPSLVGLSDP
mmetsp:Transcript_100796/g.289370  ORF Transcript_100796/g.289370 Transcript_100796/m.289370 type:complete len:280 (+) Transcript_100796:1093-1932(+)